MKPVRQSLIDAESHYREKWLEFRYVIRRLINSDLEPIARALEFPVFKTETRFGSVSRADMETHTLHALILVAIKLMRFETYSEFYKQYEEYKDKLARGIVDVMS